MFEDFAFRLELLKFGVQENDCRVSDIWFWVWGLCLWFMVYGFWFPVLGLWFTIFVSGFMVEGLGFRV